MTREPDAVDRDVLGLRGEVAALRKLLLGDVWHYVGGTNALGTTFVNSWVNAGGGFTACRFRLEGARVALEGSIKTGTSGTTVFTLPAAYWPSYNLDTACYSDDGGTIRTGFMEVHIDGAVLAFSVGSSGAVDNVTFAFTFGLGS